MYTRRIVHETADLPSEHRDQPTRLDLAHMRHAVSVGVAERRQSALLRDLQAKEGLQEARS